MLEPFYLFSASATTAPLFSLRLQESRHQYADPQKGLRTLNWPIKSGVTFKLGSPIVISRNKTKKRNFDSVFLGPTSPENLTPLFVL